METTTNIGEAPALLEELDLMKLLASYGQGEASWRHTPLTSIEQKECRELHARLEHVCSDVFAPLLNRVTAREMESFTAHDSKHALKVAHIMWRIVQPPRQSRLTPVEIAILILAAHLHDLGMGLNDQEREARLRPDSDLWLKVDMQGEYRRRLQAMQAVMLSQEATDEEKKLAARRLHQAEEALLCGDSRERHATAERYREILGFIEQASGASKGKIQSTDSILRFGKDSFLEDLIEVCVSHNQPASSLVEPDARDPDRERFPREIPCGPCVADLRFVAALLRIADILDFDRERTPEVLFHYLLPREASPADNISVREWSKHLSIANWEIQGGVLIFRGVCDDPVVHHAIVRFVEDIEEEITTTRVSYEADGAPWPLIVSGPARAEIRAIGYKYLPYKFSLDEDRIYALLMGDKLYNTPLAAIRELLQNSVDACRLRDAISRQKDSTVAPSRDGRIQIILEEDGDGKPVTLTIQDSGVGMVRAVIEKYLLRVGNSYYKSAEFLRTDASLKRSGIQFDPVSEFGIGFISCFMIGSHVRVVTTPWRAPSAEARTRTLDIDGLTRLIHVREEPSDPFQGGTAVSISLLPEKADLVRWERLRKYLLQICYSLPYVLSLIRRRGKETIEETTVDPHGLDFSVPEELAEHAVIIDVDEPEMRGRIALFRVAGATEALAREAQESFVNVGHDEFKRNDTVLIRGGFKVSEVPGVPEPYLRGAPSRARIEVLPVNSASSSWGINLARNASDASEKLAAGIQRAWLSYFLNNLDDIGQMGSFEARGSFIRADLRWMERWSAFDVYRMGRLFWAGNETERAAIEAWENRERSRIFFESFSSPVHVKLLRLVLPKICLPIFAREATLWLGPPVEGWQDELSAWNKFIAEPVEWPKFMTYDREIDQFLHYEYAGRGVLNKRYEAVLGLSDEEVSILPAVLSRIGEARRWDRKLYISEAEKVLVERVIDLAPDARFHHSGQAYKLSGIFRG